MGAFFAATNDIAIDGYYMEVLDKDGQAKPSFYALHNLIHKKWHTSEEGILPLNGTINCRAFYGDYLLQLESEDGKTVDIPFRHQRGEKEPLIFSIDDNTHLLRVE